MPGRVPPSRASGARPWLLLVAAIATWPAAWSLGEWSAGRPELDRSWPHRLARQAVEVQAALEGEAVTPLAAEAPLDPTERYSRARDEDERAAALVELVEDAAPTWPAGYRRRFLAGILGAVIDAGRRYRTPPSVALAQAVLESGWGRSRLAREHNNLFGMKAGRSAAAVAHVTIEQVGGGMAPAPASFRHYPSLRESVEHHARVMSTDRRYAGAAALWTDWRAWLRAVAPRYASDRGYVARVSRIVEQFDLDRWDAAVARAAGETAAD